DHRRLCGAGAGAAHAGQAPAVAGHRRSERGVDQRRARLDLDYAEDSTAGVDFNVVADEGGQLIEVQGTGEHATFSRAQLGDLVDLALAGIGELVKKQREAL